MNYLNRREFLQSTSLAVASVCLTPVTGSLFAAPQTTNRFTNLPTIPYGAVYFRKSYPPKDDWERDYREAAKLGINAFRHWFIWSAIEVSPGKYDWDDYDRQLELAAKYGIKTIIADILSMAPDWAFKEFPHARIENAQGDKEASTYSIATAVGGHPGLCLDNREVKSYAEGFLKALAARYKDHPGMGGYDTWNEQNHFGDAGGCWCEASAAKFREWCKNRYKSLDALSEAWKRFSYRTWDDIEIPRHSDFYSDAIDWILFRVENAHELMKWRIETIKSMDSVNPVTAHCRPDKMLSDIGPGSFHTFKAGALVDIFGYTGGGNHEENTKLRWWHWIKGDITRSSSKGKPFWSAEMPSGNSWRAKGIGMKNGRVVTAKDIKLYSMTHFATGATGVFSPRWRPMLNGPVFGSFAFCNMDGSLTDRAEMAGSIANWANHPDQKKLWEARPVKGEVGIVVVPESQIQCFLLEGSSKYYKNAVIGAYQAFLFTNVQADFVSSEEINNDYAALYLPHPVMLPEKVVDSLKQYVKNGGILISEGCPAYFGNHGTAGETQPNYGLDELFGAREDKVQFTPDLLEKMKFKAESIDVPGGVYLQSYKPTTGKIAGRFEDGSPAVIDNNY
ncbi:MAG: beta-galactosidase, partial [Prolixibacteraceae bacterium]